jgi:transposase
MRAISVSQRNRIVSLLKSGETIREVSQKVGLSTATVCRIGKQACSDRKMNKGDRPQALSHANERYCSRQITTGKLDNAVKVKKALRRTLVSL